MGPAEYFTIKHGRIETDPVCRHTTLLTSCEPECCLQAEPCVEPACHWTAPLTWGAVIFCAVLRCMLQRC